MGIFKPIKGAHMKKDCAVCDKKFHGRGGLCLRCYAIYLSIETFTTSEAARRSLREALIIQTPETRLSYLQMQFRKVQFLLLLVSPGQAVPTRNKPVKAKARTAVAEQAATN